jgi:hypothetical protein
MNDYTKQMITDILTIGTLIMGALSLIALFIMYLLWTIDPIAIRVLLLTWVIFLADYLWYTYEDRL